MELPARRFTDSHADSQAGGHGWTNWTAVDVHGRLYRRDTTQHRGTLWTPFHPTLDQVVEVRIPGSPAKRRNERAYRQIAPFLLPFSHKATTFPALYS